MPAKTELDSARADYNGALANLSSAQAQVNVSRAQLSTAQTNLSIDQYKPEKYEALVGQRKERKTREQMQVAEGGELAHYNLGVAFRQKGYYTEALREYRLALPNEKTLVKELEQARRRVERNQILRRHGLGKRPKPTKL